MDDRILQALNSLEMRINSIILPVTVIKNHGDGTVDLDDETGFEPKGVPVASLSAGSWKVDATPDTGTKGFIISPTGKPELGWFWPTMGAGDNPRATTDIGALRLKGPGGESLTLQDGGLTLDIPETATTKAATFVVEAGTITFKGNMNILGALSVNGASVTHNGTNIGDTHKHKDVTPGTAKTGLPV